jgi:hypothetical protein
MTFVYYSADDEAIYFLTEQATDHGVLIGSVSSLPKRPAFVVQSLMSNAGFHGITGLVFVYGKRQPPNEEVTPQ